MSIFFVIVNMGPYGSQNVKTLRLPEIALESFQRFPNFFLSGPHKSSALHFWNFEFSIFNELLNFTIVPYGEIKKP